MTVGRFFVSGGKNEKENMAYSTGMMNKRVTIAQRYSDSSPTFGGSNTVTKYTILGTFWAAEDYSKGTKSLREGAYDAYDYVMFRMRYNAQIDRWCLIKFREKWYQIQSLNEDYQTNQIQITAIEMANQQVTIVDISSSELTGVVEGEI